MGAEIQDGAVLVARAILNSSLWTMSLADRVVAITCICLACWKPRKWFDGKEQVTLERGQFVRGRKKLAQECGISEDQLRTSIEHLEIVGFLTRKITSRYTVFTIPKYSHYQDLTKYSDSSNHEVAPDFAPSDPQPIPNASPADPQPIPTYKNDNKENKEKKDKNDSLSAKVNSVEAHIISAWNRGPGFPIGHPQGQKLVRAYIESGVPAERQLEAVSNQPTCKGKKFWEVIEPLRPHQDVVGVPTISQILEKLTKESK